MDLTPAQTVMLRDRNTQIGNICWQWAHLEYLIALAIWAMLRIDHETGKVVTGGLDIKPRVNMAINLGHHLRAPKEAIQALIDVRTALDDDLITKRNRAVHGHRLLDPDDPTADLVEVHRGKGDRKRSPQTNQDLRALGIHVKAVADALKEKLDSSGVYFVAGNRPTPIIAP